MSISHKCLVLFVTAMMLFLPGSFVLAQDATSTPTVIAELQQIIDKLKEQINALQTRISELKAQSSITKEEFQEIKETYKFIRTLRQGITGEDVKILQEYLKLSPDLYPEGLVTSYFGPLTETAVKSFQEVHGIVASGTPDTTGYGQAGPRTRTKLNELIAEGAGASGEVPTGLSVAPGLADFFDTVNTTTTVVTDTDGGTATTSPAIGTDDGVGIVDTATTTSIGDTATSTATATSIGDTSSSTATTTDTVTTSGGGGASGGGSSGSTSDTSTTPPADDVSDDTSTSSPPSGGDGSTPSSSTLGPLITGLSITPTSGDPDTVITFSVTAENAAGITNVIYDIKYPGSSYTLRPNCNFFGDTNGTCTFSQDIAGGIFPTLLGGYVIETIRATDGNNHDSIWYPDGTVDNASISSHSFIIPVIYIGVEPPSEDTTPPAETTTLVITDVKVSNIINNSVHFTWTTNEPAKSKVTITKGTNSFSKLYQYFVTDHFVNFDNYFSPGDTQYYMVTSINEAGHIVSSPGYSFVATLDTTSPVISNIQVINITETSAIITWTTNEVSDSGGTYYSVSPKQAISAYNESVKQVTSHSLVIGNLKAKTTFFYTVSSTDLSGNTTTSSEQSFTTLAKETGKSSQMSLYSSLASVIEALQQLVVQLQSQL